MRVSDASFVVVDTETTGGRAADDRVIEIGAVKVRAGRIVDRFEQLINPERSVSRQITRLTGISTAMLFDQPVAREVLPGFRSFLGDGVFVAHNLRFDLGFLNRECRRIGKAELPNSTLCTLRLARRLLSGLRSKGLASVADFYGIRNRRHHRALPDAETTAEILLRFLDQLELEFGIEELADLVTFQHRRYRELKRLSSHVTRIRDEVLDELPGGPGVYFMKDAGGKTLYIGKAQNLRSRVRSYFMAVEGHPPRIRKMIKSVRSIDWEETESELDALVLESRLIKENQPPHNRAQRRYVNRPFIRIDTKHPFPRVTSSAFLHDDGSEYYGPLANRDEALFFVELINRFFRLRECEDAAFAKGRKCVYASMGRCMAPCEDEEVSHYSEELQRVRAFLSGVDDSVSGRIEDAMTKAAAELDYEQAGEYRDWLARLRRVLGKREVVARRVLDHNAVVVHQASDRPARLLVISRGRHVDTLQVDEAAVGEVLPRLEETLGRHFGAGPTAEVYREREIDELYLLSHWLYVHRNEARQIHWRKHEPVGAVVEKVGRLLAVTA